MPAPVELFADGGVTFASLSYGLAAVVFLGAFLVTLRKRLSTQDSAALLPALLGSAAWGGLQAWDARVEFLGAVGHYFVDVLRFTGWLAFVALALPRRSPDRWLRFLPWAAGAVCGLGGVAGLAFQVSGDLGGRVEWPDWLPVVFGLMASMLGLVLVEQAARNLQAGQYWARKHVLIAVGLMMAYDLVTFSAGYVLMDVPPELREARGAAHALTGLVLMFGIRRLGRTQSQRGSGSATFFTTTLVVVGGYLMVVALMGFYVRALGGTWGGALQALLMAFGVCVMALLAFSAEVRARFRVWVAKNFSAQKYDYREEWLRFARTLEGDSARRDVLKLHERVVVALGAITGSPQGGLWVRRNDRLVPVAGELASAGAPAFQPGAWLDVMARHQWILDMRGGPPPGLGWEEVPEWLRRNRRIWLLVPLSVGGRLEGLAALTAPLASSGPQAQLTWEDIDLVRTAAAQAGGFLALERTLEELGAMRQFEAFNQFVAFLMHDLKNVLAQQQLVVQNFPRFRDNPEFIEDAIATVDNATKRMARLIQQLQAGETAPAARRPVDVALVCAEVVAATRDRMPAPVLEATAEASMALADHERLANVLQHLVRNAQEATPGNGTVTVQVAVRAPQVLVTVADTGTGMDEAFIRDRLFRPFDTTKGAQGMGIGAYQAREYLRSLGGDVYVDSVPGQGTRLTLALPLAQ